MYRELVLPYTKELAPAIQKHGVAMGYHICGNTNKITEAMLESGCDIPVDAPVENIYAFMDAVREYGPTRLGEKK